MRTHFSAKKADSRSSSIQEKMKPSPGKLGLMKKHAGVVFGEKKDLGNPNSSSLPSISHSKKANERQVPEPTRLSATNPTLPGRPRNLQGFFLLKCEAITHSSAYSYHEAHSLLRIISANVEEADPSLV